MKSPLGLLMAVWTLFVFNPHLRAQVNFTLASSPSVPGFAQCVVAADINGDGKVDLKRKRILRHQLVLGVKVALDHADVTGQPRFILPGGLLDVHLGQHS